MSKAEESKARMAFYEMKKWSNVRNQYEDALFLAEKKLKLMHQVTTISISLFTNE